METNVVLSIVHRLISKPKIKKKKQVKVEIFDFKVHRRGHRCSLTSSCQIHDKRWRHYLVADKIVRPHTHADTHARADQSGCSHPTYNYVGSFFFSSIHCRWKKKCPIKIDNKTNRRCFLPKLNESKQTGWIIITIIVSIQPSLFPFGAGLRPNHQTLCNAATQQKPKSSAVLN